MPTNQKRFCFLAGRKCNVETDLRNPSCFISIPFKRETELNIIKNTIKDFKLIPLVAENKPPQFLFHDICEKISKSMLGVFEVTEPNEGVFAEYGIMVEQGKPSILLYNKSERTTELHSNFRGILQTRYVDSSKLSSELLSTFFTLYKKMNPPEASIIKLHLLSYRLDKEMQEGLKAKDYVINASESKIRFSDETQSVLKYKVKISLDLEKEESRFKLGIPIDVDCLKKKIAVRFFGIDSFVKSAEVAEGVQLTEEIERFSDEISDIMLACLNAAENLVL